MDSNPAPTCKQPTPVKIPSADGIRLRTASLLLRLPGVREDSSTSDWSRSQFSDSVLHFARRGSNPFSGLQAADAREDPLDKWTCLSSAIQCFISRVVDSNPAPTCEQLTPGNIPSVDGSRLCTRQFAAQTATRQGRSRRLVTVLSSAVRETWI